MVRRDSGGGLMSGSVYSKTRISDTDWTDGEPDPDTDMDPDPAPATDPAPTATDPTPDPASRAGGPVVDPLAEVRRRAVAAAASGVPQVDVARIFGVSRQAVGRWLRNYRDGGEEALRSGRRGRRPGEQLALSPGQQQWVVSTFAAHAPEQLGLRYALWGRQALAELINRELGIPLSATSVRNYLIRWGVVDEQANLRHLRGEHAALAAASSASHSVSAAGALRGETLWADWCRLARSADKGRHDRHAAEVTLARAFSNRGVTYFLAINDPFDGIQVCDFLERLRDQTDRKVNIVLRWRPRHNATNVAHWQSTNEGQVAVRFIED